MMAPRAATGPAPDVPLRYLLASAAAFIAACLGVVWLASELAGHYYHPRVVALTHTVTLGWITLAVMGASYQLLPIVLGRPIWSERLARLQFWVLLVSLSGMVAHFYLGTRPGLVLAAALLAFGVTLHLINGLASLGNFDRWTFTARLIVLAYAGLALTVDFGLALGVDRLWPFLPGAFFPTLHAHVHLALLGFLMPMVLGVAARVYPMFLLAPEPAGRSAQVQLWGLAFGAPTVVLGLALGFRVGVMVGAVAVASAAGGHLAWVARMAWSRRRPRLDWGLRFALTGAAFVVPGTLLGLGLAFDLISGPRPALAYAVVVLGGWISLTIAGMMLKILPFLVWFRVYSSRVGKMPVPTMPELSWPRAEGAAYVLLTGGFIGLAGAVAAGSAGSIRAAGIILSLGALAFGAGLARVLCHLFPRASTETRAPAGNPIVGSPQGSRA
jgi:hypothetical protein